MVTSRLERAPFDFGGKMHVKTCHQHSFDGEVPATPPNVAPTPQTIESASLHILEVVPSAAQSSVMSRNVAPDLMQHSAVYRPNRRERCCAAFDPCRKRPDKASEPTPHLSITENRLAPFPRSFDNSFMPNEASQNDQFVARSDDGKTAPFKVQGAGKSESLDLDKAKA